MKTTIIATLLLLAPGIAYAQCSSSTASMSCAEGTAYDQTSGTCVPMTT